MTADLAVKLLLLVTAALVGAGLATASTALGFAALTVVGVAWLVRDCARARGPVVTP